MRPTIETFLPGFLWKFFTLTDKQVKGEDAGTLFLNPNQGVMHVIAPGRGMRWSFFFRNWDGQYMTPTSDDHKFIYETPYEALVAMLQFTQVWQTIEFQIPTPTPIIEEESK